MRIALTERLQQDVRALREDQRAALFEVILSLPVIFGDPHRHTGIGLRKLHPSGIWEARLGLGLRLLFTMRDGEATLVLVGSHDEIRRYLRSL